MKPADLKPGLRIVTAYGELTVDAEVFAEVGPEWAEKYGVTYRPEDDRVHVDVKADRRVDIPSTAALAAAVGALDAQFLSLSPTVRYRLFFTPDTDVTLAPDLACDKTAQR